jgi:glycosyltransferase involved in cell wall biosynthesis
MRVTHISVVHRPQDTRIFGKECRALAGVGYDVHLIVGGAPRPMLDGVAMHSISRTDARPPMRRQPSRMFRAVREAFSLRPSVYHLHDPHLIPLGLALKLVGARVVYDVHEDYPAHARSKLAHHPARAAAKARLWGALEWLARRTFDAFVCASPTLARRFPAGRTVVVGNQPLHREYARGANGSARPYTDRPNTILYVGSITRIRSFWEMAQAVEMLPRELDCRLRVIGACMDDVLRRAMTPLSDSGRIEFVSFQPHPAVIHEMLSAKVGLVLLHPLPNHHDPLRSNKLFEYMAAGVPVIASDLPEWRRIVLGIGCGLVVDPLDPAALAQAIRWLLEHPEEAEAMGRRGREAVQRELNWDAEEARLLSLYRRLTADRERVRAVALSSASPEQR